MIYTARFAHLNNLPQYSVGDKIFRGDVVGRMGSTGQSKVAHLHIDVVEGHINSIIRLKDIGYDKQFIPNIIQLNYFIDDELFNNEPFITTCFYDPFYKALYGKDHPAYDVVPIDRHLTDEHFDIHWNRSKTGVVFKKGYDERGYGNYILIGFEA